jgi:hypothetical protein
MVSQCFILILSIGWHKEEFYMLPGYTSGTNNSWKTNVKFYYEGLVILDLIGTIFSLLDALIATSNFHSQNVLADFWWGDTEYGLGLKRIIENGCG